MLVLNISRCRIVGKGRLFFGYLIIGIGVPFLMLIRCLASVARVLMFVLARGSIVIVFVIIEEAILIHSINVIFVHIHMLSFSVPTGAILIRHCGLLSFPQTISRRHCKTWRKVQGMQRQKSPLVGRRPLSYDTDSLMKVKMKTSNLIVPDIADV